MSSAAAGLPDELVRDARERSLRTRVEAHARHVMAVPAVLTLAGLVACAAFLQRGPAFSPWTTALFVVLYAVVSRVEFEIGPGSAIPTQLVLVPMLFALPAGIVPAAVAAGLVLRTVGERPWPLRDPARLLAVASTTAHTLGPVLVLCLAGGLPLRWSAWPVYLLALGAQFAFEFVNAVVTVVANGISLLEVTRVLGLVYLVDAALAPVGILLAFGAVAHPELALLGLPLVGLLRTFADERRRRIDSALELSDAYRGTALLLGDVIEADDAYTGSHSRHVVDLVRAVADRLGLTAAERRDAEFVALLHDVGKIRIPSEIINKPGALDDDEWALMQTHTVEGERMLERVGGLLGHVGRLVRSCHERWDGTGYPDRLAGEAIPLVARIVCACDAYSAMTTDRPYRRALARDEALAELERNADTQFDTQVVAAILAVESVVRARS